MMSEAQSKDEKVPKAELDATPEVNTWDTTQNVANVELDGTPRSGDTVFLSNDQMTTSCVPDQEGSQVKTESTAQLGLEKEHEDAKKMEITAQEGVDIVQAMLDGDNSKSPVFLCDMVKKSKKRKKNDDGKWLCYWPCFILGND